MSLLWIIIIGFIAVSIVCWVISNFDSIVKVVGIILLAAIIIALLILAANIIIPV